MKKTSIPNPLSALRQPLETMRQKLVKGCHAAAIPCAFAVIILCSVVTFAYVGYKAEAYVLPYELNNAVTRLPFSHDETLPCALIEDNTHYITGKTFRFTAADLVAQQLSSPATPSPSTSLTEVYLNNLLKIYGLHPQKTTVTTALNIKNPFLESLLTLENPTNPYIQEANQCNPLEGQPSLLALSHRTPGAYKGFSQRGQISQYRAMAERYAEKYNLPASLVMAIIKAESNFNPHAVSAQQAIGLMQIVPNTAGEEVHAYLHGHAATPEFDVLFQPDRNILYGTTYLHLLEKRYFQQISNQTSRQLCIIAAYNGGPGAVLRVFDSNMDTAVGIINTMTPDQVYTSLSTGMPFAESRQYIDLVLGNIRNF